MKVLMVCLRNEGKLLGKLGRKYWSPDYFIGNRDSRKHRQHPLYRSIYPVLMDIHRTGHPLRFYRYQWISDQRPKRSCV